MRLICLLAGTMLATLGLAQVKVERVDYRGWAGSYKISNGTVEVVVVPQIGRVMRYAYADGPNVLWENDALFGKVFPADAKTYRNYGGDKMWVAPQSRWTWPPDPLLDGSPWTVEPTPTGVKMTSQVGTVQSVRFTRDISLAAVGTEVMFRNSLLNKGERQAMAIWQVTQVNDPDRVTMPVEITAAQGKGWYGFGRESLDERFHTMASSTLQLRRDPATSRKFGARSLKGVLTAAIGATRFVTESRAYKVDYPDQNSAQQVYLSADPYKYVELEHLGPLTRMETGEVVLQTVKWHLERG
jgi:hypothetical protein